MSSQLPAPLFFAPTMLLLLLQRLLLLLLLLLVLLLLQRLLLLSRSSQLPVPLFFTASRTPTGSSSLFTALGAGLRSCQSCWTAFGHTCSHCHHRRCRAARALCCRLTTAPRVRCCPRTSPAWRGPWPASATAPRLPGWTACLRRCT